MLTAWQVQTVAGVTEAGELLCLSCAETEYTKPIIRYSLDEEQTARSYGYYDGENGHRDGCECEPAVDCEQCGTALAEPYTDPDCSILEDADSEEDEPWPHEAEAEDA